MTTKAQLLQSIHQYCLGCSGGSYKEVEHCTVTYCELYPYRKGIDPHPARKGQKVPASPKNFSIEAKK
jgi:hypothetical protein